MDGGQVDAVLHDGMGDAQVAGPGAAVAEDHDLVARQLDAGGAARHAGEQRGIGADRGIGHARLTSPSASATPSAEAPRDSPIEA